jgi:predicted MFS family arabinose efflux permease
MRSSLRTISEGPDMSIASADPHTATTPDHARRNLLLLAFAQAFIGAQLPVVSVLAGLAGQSLASNICWATLPISAMGLGSMTSSGWISWIMQRYGRQAGFLCGTLGGAVGAAVSAWGLLQGSFVIFVAGAYFTGIYMAAQSFYRFAAMDAVSERFRPRAMSFVMAGGLASAVIGTQITKLTSDIMVVPFLGSYMAVIAVNIAGAGIFLFLRFAPPPACAPGADTGRTGWQMLRDPKIARAIICAMVSYGLMTLVMTSTPLAMTGVGCSQGLAADVVMAHVLAMFLPSFFTGHLIMRYGEERIVSIGLVLLAGAGAVNLAGIEVGNFFAALILLGLGWNFGFIGATTMLSKHHSRAEQGRIQGLNDMLVFGATTIASFASGSLMNCSGGTVVEGWNAVNLATIPFLALAAIALVLPRLQGRGLPANLAAA